MTKKSGRKFFFSKIWLCQSLDIMVSYHHIQYQKKTNDQILRKLSDGWTNRRMDRRTDRRTRLIPQDAVRLLLNVQNIPHVIFYQLIIIISLPLLLEMLGNMCIVLVCFPGCDIINFEINLGFLIKPFSYMTKEVRTKI